MRKKNNKLKTFLNNYKNIINKKLILTRTIVQVRY